MLKVESHGWKSYYYWLGDGNVLLNYHPATSKGFFCHVTLHTEQPPSLQWANSDWQKKAEFHQTQTLQHWLRNGYCAQIQFQNPFPLLLLQLSSNRLEKGNMAHKKILQEFINKTRTVLKMKVSKPCVCFSWRFLTSSCQNIHVYWCTGKWFILTISSIIHRAGIINEARGEEGLC